MFVFVFMCREPDIPAWAPLLYQLQLLDFREKPDPLTLPIADRIRIGNQKRETGNFHFQREEYSLAARAYCVALDVLTTRSKGNTPLLLTVPRMLWQRQRNTHREKQTRAHKTQTKRPETPYCHISRG